MDSQSPEQIHGVDDFFCGVKVSLSFDNIANAVAPKRLQVVVDVGELSKKDGNILRLRPNLLSTGVENGGSFRWISSLSQRARLSPSIRRAFSALMLSSPVTIFRTITFGRGAISARQRKFYVAPD